MAHTHIKTVQYTNSPVAPLPHTHALPDLTDVNSSLSPSSNMVLYWTGSEWNATDPNSLITHPTPPTQQHIYTTENSGIQFSLSIHSNNPKDLHGNGYLHDYTIKEDGNTYIGGSVYIGLYSLYEANGTDRDCYVTTAGSETIPMISMNKNPAFRLPIINNATAPFTTFSRLFCGFTNVGKDVMLSADTHPSYNYFGVGFSTALGETTLHIVGSQAGTSEARQDTGITVTDPMHWNVCFYVTENEDPSRDSIVDIVIFDGETNNVLYDSVSTVWTFFPKASAFMKFFYGVRNLGAPSNRGFGFCTLGLTVRH